MDCNEVLLRLGTAVDENAIKDIEISINVKNIDESAFEGCFNLESVTFVKGSKLTLLGRNSFYEWW